jgi:hypothetical protein
MPRSGTKLLRRLLNQQSAIAIPAIETEFLPYLVSKHSTYGDISKPDVFHLMYKEMVKLPYFIYQRKRGDLVSEAACHKNCRSFTPSGVFEALVRTQLKLPYDSGIIWGDKSPSYIHHLPLIKRLYPKAKFIHIVRDVRDYCLSIQKAWGKKALLNFEWVKRHGG